jgi:hypothetical protein
MNGQLTRANLYKIIDIPEESYFGDFLSHFKDLSQFKYILVIQSLSLKCMKLSIYPLQDKNVIKVILYQKESLRDDKSISEAEIARIINELNKVKIIHTSGLLMKKGKPIFEAYLNINLSKIHNSIIQNVDQFINSLNLKISFEKIKLMKEVY